MKILKQFSVIWMVLFMLGVGVAVQAQTLANRNTTFLVKRLEINTDQFRNSVDLDLENDRMETIIEARIAGLEWATDRLRERLEDNEFIPTDLQDVLSRALLVERSLQGVKLSADALEDWARIKSNLDALAKDYKVAWVWTLDANPYWRDTEALEAVTDRLDTTSDQFRRSFNYAIDTSALNGTKLEDEAMQLVKAFEDQLDRWETMADNERRSVANVELLLKRAAAIEAFMQTNKIVMPRAWRDWLQVRANLDELAMLGNVKWTWNVTPVVMGQAVQFR